MLSVKPWRLEAVMQLMLALLLSLSVGMMMAIMLTKLDVAQKLGDKNFASFCVITLVFHLSALVLISFFLRQHQVTWSEAFGFWRRDRLRAVALAILLAVVILPVAWILGELSVRVLTVLNIKYEVQQPVQTLKAMVSWGQRAAFGVIAMGMAPVVEEFVFRGIIYPCVKQLGYPRIALWGTSLFFALTHFNLMTFVPLTILAVALTLLYEATDTLLAPIVTHSLFNAANYYWLLWQQAAVPGN